MRRGRRAIDRRREELRDIAPRLTADDEFPLLREDDSTGKSIGFGTKSSIPDARHRSRASASTSAVMAIIAMCRPGASRRRILAAAS